MQRNFISKFSPLLCDISRGAIIVPALAVNRSFQSSPIQMQHVAPGKLTPKMARLQKQFQEKNNKPVFLKGGGMDNILYRLTLLLAVVGLFGDAWLFLGYLIA